MREFWADIPGHVGEYQVSDLGRVRSLSRNVPRGKGTLPVKGKILKQFITNTGRLEVHLSHNGKWQHWLVHRLVATVFLPNPNNFPQINHLNGNPLDNRLANLEWCNQSLNEIHKIHNLKVKNSSLLSQPRKVLLVEHNEIFNSLGEACRKTGIPLYMLFNRLKTGKPDKNGFHWEYVVN